MAALAARELRQPRDRAARNSDLDVETNVPNKAIRDVDLQGLVDSDWVAYTFAEKNRTLLGIPATPSSRSCRGSSSASASSIRARASNVRPPPNEDTASDAGPDADRPAA